MKAIFVLLVAMVLALTFIIGCGGNESPTAPSKKIKAAGTMSAIIDGVPWSAGNNPTGQKSAYAWYTPSTGRITIHGKKYNAPATTGSTIELSIAAFGEGTFIIGTGTNSASYENDETHFTSDILNTTGSVTITKLDKNNKIIKGEFELQGKGIGGIDANGHIYYLDVNITNGKFDVDIENY